MPKGKEPHHVKLVSEGGKQLQKILELFQKPRTKKFMRTEERKD